MIVSIVSELEMAPQLRAHTLFQRTSVAASTHVRSLTVSSKSDSRRSTDLIGIYTVCPPHTGINTYIQLKISKKILKKI